MEKSKAPSSSPSSTPTGQGEPALSPPGAPQGAREPVSRKRYDRPLTLAELAAMSDNDIDYSDIPEATEEFWKNARVVWPERLKVHLSLRLDPDIVAFFKKGGRGYQTRMNAVLRAYVAAHKQD